MNNIFRYITPGDLKGDIVIAIDKEYGNYITITDTEKEGGNRVVLYHEPAYKSITYKELSHVLFTSLKNQPFCPYSYKISNITADIGYDAYDWFPVRNVRNLIDFVEYFTTGKWRNGVSAFDGMELRFEEIARPDSSSEYSYLKNICRFVFKGTKGKYKNSTYEIINNGIIVKHDSKTLICTESMLWDSYYIHVNFHSTTLEKESNAFKYMHELLMLILKEIYDEKFSGHGI